MLWVCCQPILACIPINLSRSQSINHTLPARVVTLYSLSMPTFYTDRQRRLLARAPPTSHPTSGAIQGIYLYVRVTPVIGVTDSVGTVLQIHSACYPEKRHVAHLFPDTSVQTYPLQPGAVDAAFRG